MLECNGAPAAAAARSASGRPPPRSAHGPGRHTRRAALICGAIRSGADLQPATVDHSLRERGARDHSLRETRGPAGDSELFRARTAAGLAHSEEERECVDL